MKKTKRINCIKQTKGKEKIPKKETEREKRHVVLTEAAGVRERERDVLFAFIINWVCFSRILNNKPWNLEMPLLRDRKEVNSDEYGRYCCSRLEKMGFRECEQLLTCQQLKEISDKSEVPLTVLNSWKYQIENGLSRPFQDLSSVKDSWVSKQVYFPTGITSLDSFLSGGIVSGEITQISGDEGSGKTQLCHSLAASVANSGGRVVYLDTESTLSAERIVIMLKKKYPTVNPRDSIQLIQVVRIFSVTDLLQVLHLFLHEENISLLIIDSILGVLVPHFTHLDDQGDQREQYAVIREVHRLLASFRVRHPSTGIIVTASNACWFKRTWFSYINRCLHLSVKEKMIIRKKKKTATTTASGSVEKDEEMEEEIRIVREVEVRKSIDFTMKVLHAAFAVIITDAGFTDYTHEVKHEG